MSSLQKFLIGSIVLLTFLAPSASFARSVTVEPYQLRIQISQLLTLVTQLQAQLRANQDSQTSSVSEQSTTSSSLSGVPYVSSQVSPVSISASQFSAILNGSGPSAVYYSTADVQSSGTSADVLKVVQTTDSSHPYLGLFHKDAGNGLFDTYAAYSTDLKKWTTIERVDTASGMPDIAQLSDGSILYAAERNPSGTRPFITVRYYTNLSAFLTNPSTPSRSIDLPQTAGASADGTPQFGRIRYDGSIAKSTIEITYHYFEGTVHDQEAVGTLTNFNSWSGAADTTLNQAMANLGYTDLGDREWFQIGSTAYEVLEARPSQDAGWSAWRLFLINKDTGVIQTLAPAVPGGAYSLGNPSGSFVTLPGGTPALLFSFFIFTQGARNTPPGQYLTIYPLTAVSTNPGTRVIKPIIVNPKLVVPISTIDTGPLDAPTGLSFSCAQAGDAVTLSWQSVPGATYYKPRIAMPSGSPLCVQAGWQLYSDQTTCFPNPDSYKGTSVTMPVVPGTTYSWWTEGANDSRVGTVAHAQFTCAVPAATNVPQTKIYNAVSGLQHNFGRTDGDGWSAATALDSEGTMLYGPYATDWNGSSVTATFRMMVDNNSADDLTVATIDIYDSTAGKILAIQDLHRKSFANTMTYQDFNLSAPIAGRTGHAIETRVYWHDVSYVRVGQVSVQISGATASSASNNSNLASALTAAQSAATVLAAQVRTFLGN